MLRSDNLFERKSLIVFNSFKEADERGELEVAVYSFFQDFSMDDVDMITIWRCRDYICKLSDGFYENHLELISVRILIEAMRGMLFKTDVLLLKLGASPDNLHESNPSMTGMIRMMAEMFLPQYSNEEFYKRQRFFEDKFNQSATGLALTACRPSVINGFRDFSDLCLQMDEKEEKIEKAIYSIYGKNAKGVFNIAKAEWKYERGDNLGALVQLAGTVPLLDSEQDMCVLFVAYILQLKILLFSGETKTSKELFNLIRKKIYETCSEELEESLIAAECLHNCYKGNIQHVEDWLMNDAPDENDSFFTMDMFSYFVKMRCYLQTKQYMMTILLAKKILSLLKPSQRPHDKCECHIILAIAFYKEENEKMALEELDKAFEIAEEFRYVRVFADEGQVMLNLLKLYKHEKEKNPSAFPHYNEIYIKEIRSIAVGVARTFPVYLQADEVKEYQLTYTEHMVLELMAEGMTNEDIGNALDKKEGTIKFHTASIYRKFDVANRQQAINFARGKGIIAL